MLSYVFLKVDELFKDDIKKELKNFDFTVDEVNDSSGKYNVVARVITDNRLKLYKFIYDHLYHSRNINKIKTFRVI